MRAAVIGLGAIGSQVARQLGVAGALEVLLIDHDLVEAGNLGRDPLYTADDVGRFKADALARRCRERFSGTRFTPRATEIADVGWQWLRRYDVLFGCVDRDSARLEIARIGTRLGLPVCDGGVSASRGRVTWFRDACFGCRLTTARRRELLRSWQSQPHPCGRAGAAPTPTGNTPVAPAIAAAMIDSAIRGEHSSYSLEIRPGTSPQVERFELARSPECPFHEESTLEPAVGKFARLLESAREVVWEWPICTAARCEACGAESRPFVCMARLESGRRCDVCGSGRVLPVAAIRGVSRDSEWAGAMPHEIGLPDHHLYVTRL